MKKLDSYEQIHIDLLEQCNIKPNQSTGLSRIGWLEQSMNLQQLCFFVKQKLDSQCLRYKGNLKNMINKVAVSSGSGSSALRLAYENSADVLITGDIKHDKALEAQELGICLIDAGHYETERPSMQAMIQGLQARINPLECSTELLLSAREKVIMKSI